MCFNSFGNNTLADLMFINQFADEEGIIEEIARLDDPNDSYEQIRIFKKYGIAPESLKHRDIEYFNKRITERYNELHNY